MPWSKTFILDLFLYISIFTSVFACDRQASLIFSFNCSSLSKFFSGFVRGFSSPSKTFILHLPQVPLPLQKLFISILFSNKLDKIFFH